MTTPVNVKKASLKILNLLFLPANVQDFKQSQVKMYADAQEHMLKLLQTN